MPDLNEVMTYAGTGVAAIISYVFASNIKMREGITDFLLKKMNQTKIKKIPLSSHRLFGMLEQRQSTLTTFIIDDPVKLHFYSVYIDVAFRSLKELATKAVELEQQLMEADINKKKNKEEPLPTFDATVLELMYKSEEVVRKEVESILHIPSKVERSFNQWRAMMTNAFQESMKAIINDDLFDNDYFMAYRVLDVISFYVETLLQTGAVEMSRLNGAFKGLTIEDIKKKNNGH